MSRNIEQVYTDNPSTTVSDDDLIYKGNTPYGPTDDSAIKFSDLQSQLFQQNRLESYQNFGQGERSEIELDDSDFSGGPYVLTNPCPNIISINCSTPGHTLQLPSAQGDNSFELYTGPEIINIGTVTVSIVSFLGIPQTPSTSGSHREYILIDNSTTGGLWDAQGIVTGVNGETGDVDLLAGANINITPNGDGTVTIAASSGPSAVSSGQCNFFITGNTMDTIFSAPLTATPILSDHLSVIYQNNFNATLSGNTVNVNFITAAARHIKIDACFTVRTSSILTQTYTLYLVIAGSPSSMTGPVSSITVSPTGAPGPQEISLTYNLQLTGPSQSIQFWVSNDAATADPVRFINGAVTILDTTQYGGFSSTDVLPQGTNNLYLSQDGGTTYQNVNGIPVVVGNVPTFNSVGGKLQDSGTALSGFVKQGDSGIYFGAPVSSPFVSPKMINLYGATGTGAGSQNWYSSADNYPIFQVSPVDHDATNLNFDCYFDGTNTRASTSGNAYRLNKSGGSLNFQWSSAAQGAIIASFTNFMTIDGSGRVTIPSGGSLETLRLGTSSSALNTTTPALSFSANYGAGNLLNLAGSGRNIGFQTNLMFLTYNANYNSGVSNYQVSSTGSVFAQEITSTGIVFKYQNSGTGGATASLTTAMTIDANGLVGLPLLSSASTLLGSDSGRHIQAATGFYTLSGMTFDNGGGPLLSTTAPVVFSSALTDGDYINLGGLGRNIGVTSTNGSFMSYNLDWDGGAATYKFNTSANGYTMELTSSGFVFRGANAGTAGASIVPTNFFTVASGGAALIGNLTMISAAVNVISVENGSSFRAKNTGGTYETFMYPRFSDNVFYMNYGSGGMNIRNVADVSAFMLTNGLDVQIPSGNLVIQSATKGLQVKSVAVSAGTANGLCVTGCILVAGTVTVSNSAVTTSHQGIVTNKTVGGTVGHQYVVCGSSTFTVNSTSPLDTSTVSVLFYLPN